MKDVGYTASKLFLSLHPSLYWLGFYTQWLSLTAFGFPVRFVSCFDAEGPAVRRNAHKTPRAASRRSWCSFCRLRAGTRFRPRALQRRNFYLNAISNKGAAYLILPTEFTSESGRPPCVTEEKFSLRRARLELQQRERQRLWSERGRPCDETVHLFFFFFFLLSSPLAHGLCRCR